MCEVSPDLNPQDLEFITDIARILVVAQRQLSYAYVARYYLAGQKKQEFMDFQLVQLESYVDYYKQKVQERWVDKLEIGNTGAFTVMSKDFCAYKNAMLKDKKTFEEHFALVMQSIEDGIPEVKQEVGQQQYILDQNQAWTCTTCQVSNQAKNTLCSTCRAKRPGMQ